MFMHSESPYSCITFDESSQNCHQFRLIVTVLTVVLYAGLERHDAVLAAHVQHVVNTPVDLPYAPSRMPQPLHYVQQYDSWTEGDSHCLNGLHDCVDDVGACLKDVGPHVVKEMDQRIFAPEALNAQSEMLHGCGCCLSMHEIAISESILQQWGYGVDVVLGHFANVLEHEGETLEDAVLDVQLLDTILIHQSGNGSKRSTGFRYDSNGYCGTDSELPLLNLQVVQERYQHVLWADCLGNIPKGVDSGSANALFVRLQELKKIEADPHPLFRRHLLRALVSYLAHQIDAVFLHLFISVFQDGRQSRQQVLDWGRHLVHAHFNNNSTESPEYTSQHFRELLSEAFIEVESQPPQPILLAADFHAVGDLGDEVGCLHSDPGAFVVENPLDGSDDLDEVGLGAQSKRVDDSSEPIDDDGIVAGLLVEGTYDAIDQLHFQCFADIVAPTSRTYLLDCLHRHLPERLVFILKGHYDLFDHFGSTYLGGQLHCSFYQLLVVALFDSHSSEPEAAEVLRHYHRADVACLYTLARQHLLYHLQHDLTHLLLGVLELLHQARQYSLGVFARMVGFHEGNDVADGFEEGPQRLIAVVVDSLPERNQHKVECLDTVGC